ncbi:MAG: hypothetical protein KZQ83_08275 [gamma proteobacterium symbiont of Taylorina sp.]|nr:hypothetical protein [gamma proteobacterium symbiont of Taylorina sp.]
MIVSIKSTFVIIALAAVLNISLANDLMVFPAKGQSDKQIEQDKYSCYGWAKGQTGFDPMKTPTTSTPPPSQTKKSGGVVKGGLGGAALGGIFGGSKGAKRGAAAGGLIGGVRQSSANSASQQKTEQWQQQEASKYANNRDKYNRAYSACLEGKGYTVK